VHLEADDRFFSEPDGMDLERAKPLCVIGRQNGMQFAYPVSTGKSDKYAAMLGGRTK
jgi:hypothetical protein